FGATPAPLKAVGVLLHIVNTVLVFQLIRQLFKRFDYAIIVAGLFALNTVQVESVAWLAGSMKIGAYSLFFLSSLLAYVRYLKGDRKSTRLNSSHVKISYAVFCLKKKKE